MSTRVEAGFALLRNDSTPASPAGGGRRAQARQVGPSKDAQSNAIAANPRPPAAVVANWGAVQRTKGPEGGPHQTVIVSYRIRSLSQLIKSTQRLSPTVALKPRRRWLRVRSRSRLRQGVRMPAYRVFSFGHNGRFLSVKHMECTDDQDAVQKAQHGTDGYDAEVWEKGRCVVRMPSTPSPKYTANKPRAPIVLLSLAKRTALIECFNNDGLHKLRGCWCGTPARQAYFRCHGRRPLARRHVLRDHKSTIWFGRIDRTRPMVCTDAD